MGSALIFLPFLGVFFVAIGAAVGSAAQDKPWLATIFYAIGVAAFALWVVLDRENFKRFFARKGSKYGASSGVSLLLGILILVGLGFVSQKPRFNKSFDMTRSRANTLSEQSVKIVDTIKEKKLPIEIVGFFQDDQQQAFRNLLQLYEAKGLDVKVTMVDPRTDPTTAMAYKITQANTVIVKSPTQESRVTTMTEEKLTNAFVAVMKEGVKKIYFTKGHGEGQLEGQDADGFKAISEELKNNKYEVGELSLLESGKIPEDASLIVMAGPKYDLKAEEIALLDQYLQKGKPFLVMVDAMVQLPTLNGLLKDYGLAFEDDLLILSPDDPRAAMLGQNNAIISDFDEFNVITKDYARKSNVALLLPNTRSIVTQATNKHNLKPSAIASSSEVVIGVTNVRSQNDLKGINKERIKTGKFPVIGVSTGRVGGAELAKNDTPNSDQNTDSKEGKSGAKAQDLRIVAVGSSQLATNLGAQRAENLNMMTNITGFLLQDEDFIAIKPKDLDKSTIDLTSPSSQITLAMLTWIYPFIFLGWGLVHWLRRRRA